MENTFSIYVINVLWQVVAAKRFDPDSSESRRMMERLNKRFRRGLNDMRLWPELSPYLPLTSADEHMLDMKATMRECIEEHISEHREDEPPR